MPAPVAAGLDILQIKRVWQIGNHIFVSVFCHLYFHNPELQEKKVSVVSDKEQSSYIKPFVDDKRLLHYYIESGITVAVNVEPDCGRGIGHSLICIGHSDEKSYEKAKSIKKIKGLNGKYSIINSADLYENYVVIDDNQFPYEIRNFDKMSIYPDK